MALRGGLGGELQRPDIITSGDSTARFQDFFPRGIIVSHVDQTMSTPPHNRIRERDMNLKSLE